METEKAVGKTILIGPTHCEAGWMLQFAARARAKAANYDKVYVSCEEPMMYLFEDFSDGFFKYNVKKGKRDRWLYNGKPLKIKDENLIKMVDKIYSPSEKHCIKDRPEYHKYGHIIPWDTKYDVLIHARSVRQKDWIDKKAGGSRNYPLEWYEKIVKNFKGMKIGSIGSKEGAYHITDTEDLRGISMGKLCDLMAGAKLCIGSSSFPLHLANACGCKTIVFTDNSYQKSIHGTNRDRYERLWRMTDADVKVIDKWGWKPPIDIVEKVIKREL